MRDATVDDMMFVDVGFDCDTIWFDGGCIGAIFDGCMFSIGFFFSDNGNIVSGDIFDGFLI